MLRKLVHSINKQSLGVYAQSLVIRAPLQAADMYLGKISTYCRYFSDESFWKKILKYAKKVGREGISKALTIYYCANDPDTPAWARSIMAAVLGYFILPLDAIPDWTPIFGFTDDMALIATALAITAAHVKDEHKKRAEETLKRWF